MASKLSYIHTPAKEPLEYRIFPRIVDDQARKHPEREALIFYDEKGQRSSYTYFELHQKSLALAASLLCLGLKPHDRALIMAHNSLEFLVCVTAMTRIAVTPLLVPLGTRREILLSTLTRLKCRAFVGHPNISRTDADDEFLASVLKNAANVIFIGEKLEADHRNVVYMNDLLASDGENLDSSEVLKIQDTIQMDDTAMVFFTSGSTGAPKAVQHTHHSLINGCLLSAHCGYLIKEADQSEKKTGVRFFNDRPFYWSACFCWGITTALTTASTVVTLPTKKIVRDGDAAFVLKILQDEKITHALLMPYLAHDIITMGTAKFDLSSLQLGLLGGNLIAQELVSGLLKRLPWCTMVNGYGMTEVFPNGFQHFRKNDNSSVQEGMLVPENEEVKIVNDDSKVVPVGVLGEICRRGPSLFAGYLEDPEETSKAMSSTGWFHSGDIGAINDRGRLTICGRKVDIIKRATSKIYPGEIESVLSNHPKIKDVKVVGVPDQRLYEEVCACVIVKDGVELKMAELEEWEEKQWQGYEDEQGLTLKPRYNIFMEKFPLTGTGKFSRKELRIVAIENLGMK